MNALIPSIALTVLGMVIGAMAYQNIRRGGARFYTLEREAILRRAGFMAFISILFLVSAVVLLVVERQRTTTEIAVLTGEEEDTSPTATPTIASVPPTDMPTATSDPNQPTVTPTQTICRALVQGTAGSGLLLRESPGVGEVEVLQEEAILTLVPEPAQPFGGRTWVKVQTIGLTEGWVATEFLFISDPDCLGRLDGSAPLEESGSTADGEITSVCRALVQGTGGSGLLLRETPGGSEVEVLSEEAVLTLLEEPTQSFDGRTWVKVQTLGLNQGWVVVDFLFVSDADCLSRIQS